jgi:hypothetical protein
MSEAGADAVELLPLHSPPENPAPSTPPPNDDTELEPIVVADEPDETPQEYAARLKKEAAEAQKKAMENAVVRAHFYFHDPLLTGTHHGTALGSLRASHALSITTFV